MSGTGGWGGTTSGGVWASRSNRYHGATATAVGLDPHERFHCVQLPSVVSRTEPIRLEQVPFYPGVLGLCHVALHFPDVIDPPGAALP